MLQHEHEEGKGVHRTRLDFCRGVTLISQRADWESLLNSNEPRRTELLRGNLSHLCHHYQLRPSTSALTSGRNTQPTVPVAETLRSSTVFDLIFQIPGSEVSRFRRTLSFLKTKTDKQNNNNNKKQTQTKTDIHTDRHTDQTHTHTLAHKRNHSLRLSMPEPKY